MQTESMLKKLTKGVGVSGFEKDFSFQVKDMLDRYCEETKIDNFGSVVGCLKKFDSKKKTILLDAHLDRIGLIVSEVLEDGFLKFSTMGGVDERILPASEVYIMGKDVLFGVIGAIPPHLKGMSETEDKSPRISDMLIDTGLSTAELKENVSVGDVVLLKSDFLELSDGRVSSAALDNRAGMAAIFECLDQIHKKTLPVNLEIAFTVGEELGLLGARALSFDNPPDLAIVIDATHGRTYDSERSDTLELGSGAVICRGPNLHYEVTNKIIKLAKLTGIPFEIEVAPGNSGTNAWALQILDFGIPCALVSIPLRYMHTTVETVDMDDIKNTARLLSEIVLGGDSIA